MYELSAAYTDPPILRTQKFHGDNKGRRSFFRLKMSAHGSPRSCRRLSTVRMLNSTGSIFASSDHCSGVETPAQAVGRSEYCAASVLPRVFWLWSKKTLPLRLEVSHSIVTSFGCC